MSMYNDTRPRSGDFPVNLLGKILQVLGGTPTSADTEVMLLEQILEQISGASAAIAAGGGPPAGGQTLVQLDERYVNVPGDTMTGPLAINRLTPLTTNAPALEIREYWDAAAVQFSSAQFHVTQTAANTFSNFWEAYKNSDLIFRARTNGTFSSERHEADTNENMYQGRKRGTTGNKDAALASGSGVMAYDHYGWDGSAFALVARMVSVADEAFSGVANGTHLRLYATPVGSAAAVERLRIAGAVISSPVSIAAHSATAIPAGGTAGVGLRVSSATNFGVFFGSGAPTLSAAQGSLYMRSDGSSAVTRGYINVDGGTTWTAITTVL